MASSSADNLSYTSLLSSLNACSERLKKNKRNLHKAIPQVTAELDQLLFNIRKHTMNNVCPSSRVYEAQVLMNKAVVKRHAGHHLEEAQCYLLADSIWVAMERERRGVNYPTSDDALARSVLCSAMACNVLLNNKYPAGQNPIPLRAMGSASEHIVSDPGTFQTNALWCPHLSRAWAVCYRLANVLTDFNCTEMAADYYELAAIIVSVDVNGNDENNNNSSSSSRRHQQHHQNNSNSNSSHADPNNNSTNSNNNAPVRTTTFGSGASVASGIVPPSAVGGGSTIYSSNSSKEHYGMYGQRVGAASSVAGGGGNSSSAPNNYRTSYAGGSGSGPSSSSSTAHHRGAKAAPTIGIAPGMLYHYTIALLCCARTCILIQDYPRALSVIDELSSYGNYVQRELMEHIEGKVWEGRKAANTANVVNVAAVQRLSRVLAGGGSDVDGDGNATVGGEDGTVAAAVAEAAKVLADEGTRGEEQKDEVGKEEPSPATTTTASPDNNNNAAPSKASSSPPTTPPPQGAGAGAARQPFAVSADPAHHLFTLLEMGSALIQSRVMKYCVAIILGDPDVGLVAHEQIRQLKKLSEVWQHHTDSTCRVGLAKARNPSVSTSSFAAAAAAASAAAAGEKKKDAEDNDSSSSSSLLRTACTAHANETARHLYRLAETMEMIAEESGWATKGGGSASPTNNSSNSGKPHGASASAPPPSSPLSAAHHQGVAAATPTPTTLTPTRQLLSRKLLEAGTADMLTILSLLGIRSRDITVLIHRTHQGLITNKLVTLAPHKTAELAKTRNANLSSSIATPSPTVHHQNLNNVAAAAAASSTASSPVKSSSGSPPSTTTAAVETTKSSSDIGADGGDAAADVDGTASPPPPPPAATSV